MTSLQFYSNIWIPIHCNYKNDSETIYLSAESPWIDSYKSRIWKLKGLTNYNLPNVILKDFIVTCDYYSKKYSWKILGMRDQSPVFLQWLNSKKEDFLAVL